MPKFAMTPEDTALYELLKEKVKNDVKELARLLHKAAFQDHKSLPTGFEPAPLYLFQANAIHSNPYMVVKIKENLS